jgi:hypothetical protein
MTWPYADLPSLRATGPTLPPQRRPHWAADVLLAFGMLVLDGLGLAVAFFFVLGSGLDEALDPSGTSSAGELSGEEAALIGLGCLAAFAVVSCAVLMSKRAWIAGIVQGLAACAFALAALAGLAAVQSESQPSPTYEDQYTGPGGPCLSGGDNDECIGSGG